MGRQVVSSELARLESRIGALRKRDAEHLDTCRRFFERCAVAPMDREVFDLAADLRVDPGLETPDALHLAAAATGRIRVVTWDDMLETPRPSPGDVGDIPNR